MICEGLTRVDNGEADQQKMKQEMETGLGYTWAPTELVILGWTP